MPRWYWILIVLALFGAWNTFTHRAVEQPPGALAPAEPFQRAIDAPDEFEENGYHLTPRARFGITARVLASERYRIDPMARLVPYDVALGWGLMSDTSVLERVDVTQGNRFYYWRTEDDTLPLDELASHSANMHLIAADDDIADEIAALRVGQVVTIEGMLVDVRRPDGGTMNTSLSRNDSGAGACEIIWAEKLSVQ